MKLDVSLIGNTAAGSGKPAAAAELAGFDGVWTTDSVSDAFLQAFAATLATDRVDIGTAIAVAFSRSPMTVAYATWELAGASNGRFTLGLGTQVKAHIERRFSMPWSPAIPRLRDYIGALHAIFATWRTGERLRYESENYSFTLMSPVFSPPVHEHRIPIAISAVGPKMASLAGELCDGVILHPFINRAYLDNVALPAIAAGRAISNDPSRPFISTCPLFMLMADTDEEMDARTTAARDQIAFYASTPGYIGVLEAIGYGGLQPELHRLTRENRFGELGALIDDQVLGEFALIGTPEEMPGLVHARYGGKLDRTSSYLGWPELEPDRLKAIIEAFRNPLELTQPTD
jgi:probable F420-dependent oxidoreductase